MITCILIFLSISFAGFSSIGASDENEENFDCKNYNTPAEFTNSTCCDYFEFYSDEIHDIAHNKTSSYAKDNIEELSKSKNTHGLQYCIYEKYLTETAGFVAEGKYDLDKFDSFVREHAELSTYADDISSFARKCASLAAEVDVVEKQEKMTGIKAEHCNFEPKFMSNCMDVHLDAKCFKKLDDPNCSSYYDEYISKCIDDKSIAITLSFRTEIADDKKHEGETDNDE